MAEAETKSVDADRLSKLVQWFEDADEAQEVGEPSPRQLQQRDIDYYDSIQLTAEEIETLKKRGQPDTTFNFIGPKVDFLIGLEAQGRTDPKAFPRNKQDSETADAATAALRFVHDKEDLDTVFSNVWENMLKPGFGGCEVIVKRSARDRMEIKITQPDWGRIFYDPHSRKRDFSDARYKGYVLWWDRDEATKKWPEKASIIDGTVAEQVNDTTKLDDKPSWKQWVKPVTQRPRLRVVTMYWKEGEDWFMTRFVKGGILEDGKVPYVNDDGESICPMLLQSAYVDRENNRYGAVRRLIGPQDEENKARSKFLHLLTVRQTIREVGAVDDPNEMRQQLARPDGDIEVAPGLRFEIVDASPQLTGNLARMRDAQGRMEQMGPSASLQGKPSGDPSGRAIIASQQGGIVEIAPLSDRLRSFKRRVHEAIWQRIRQFWTEERMVRVTDDEDNVKFVGFNRTLTAGEKLREEMEGEGLKADQIDQEFAQILKSDPEAQAKLAQEFTENVPAEMDMDITIEESPDVVTIQQEQFEQFVTLLSSGVPINDPRFRVLVEMSALRTSVKKQILDIIDGGTAPSEQQQELEALQLTATKAQVEKLMAEVDKIISETERNKTESVKNIDDVEGNIERAAQLATEISDMLAKNSEVMQGALTDLAGTMTAPRRFITDTEGRPTGVEIIPG